MPVRKLGSITAEDKSRYDLLKAQENAILRQLGELDMQAYFLRKEAEQVMWQLSGIIRNYVDPSDEGKTLKILANGDIVVME